MCSDKLLEELLTLKLGSSLKLHRQLVFLNQFTPMKLLSTYDF